LSRFSSRGTAAPHRSLREWGEGLKYAGKGTVAEIAKMLRKSRDLPVPEPFQKTC